MYYSKFSPSVKMTFWLFSSSSYTLTEQSTEDSISKHNLSASLAAVTAYTLQPNKHLLAAECFSPSCTTLIIKLLPLFSLAFLDLLYFGVIGLCRYVPGAANTLDNLLMPRCILAYLADWNVSKSLELNYFCFWAMQIFLIVLPSLNLNARQDWF